MKHLAKFMPDTKVIVIHHAKPRKVGRVMGTMRLNGLGSNRVGVTFEHGIPLEEVSRWHWYSEDSLRAYGDGLERATEKTK